MADISKTFWEKWFGADELERVNLVKTLTLPVKVEDDEVYKHSCATLINSFLCDLTDYLEDNTCYLVGCPETPQYEFKTHLGLLEGIIVRLCEKHTLEAFNVSDVKFIPRIAKEAKIR